MISKKSYGVDVAKYQPESLRAYAKAGAKYAIVQVSVSNSIVAPRAKKQIASAKANDMEVMGYFYGCFGHSATQAASEAHFAIKNAKSIGLPKGSYLGVDWERTNNNVKGDVSQNTAAIIQAMKVIRNAGYIPLLYSGADLLRNKINTKQVVKQFGTCLWVASYAISGRVNTANFNYFPSMNGVAIWQFTDNWNNLKVDGNISLIDLKSNESVPNPQQSKPAPAKSTSTERTWTDVQGMTWHAEDGTFITGGAINLRWGASTESMLITTLPAGSVVKYNAWARDSAGRVWLQQPRGSNHYGYLVGRVGNDAWGTFK